MRTGIDINNSNGNNIHNNIIDNNRTGMIFRNQTDNTNVQENFITNNWTVGVLFLDASGGTNSPVQTAANSTFNNNNISGNWYGDIADRQAGGSLPAAGTSNLKNFECNWYGAATVPTYTNSPSGEPGYAAQIPTVYGGTATAPASHFNIVDAGYMNIDALPYLVNGTDNSGTTGFQPAPSSCTGVGPVANTSSTPANTYFTIQAAVNAASNGNTIQVAAGTYAENVTVDKPLTILGPNANVDPCSGTRVAEAIVVPSGTAAVPAGATAVETGEIFHVAASGVTIKGFTIDGNNTTVTSGVTNTTGADMDAAEGVTIYENNISNLTVSNNIFQNLSYFGVTLYGSGSGTPTAGHSIDHNKFRNLGTYNDPSTNGSFNINFWGGGVLLYNNHYAVISNNCMDNVRTGVQTGNYYLGNPAPSSTTPAISNNTLTNVRRTGIFHNLHYSAASAIAVDNNSISGASNVNETKWDGISLFSLSVPSSATGNTINVGSINQSSKGYEVWNVQNTYPTAISGGSVTGTDIGVFVNNYDGYNSDAHPFGAHASLSGITITPNATGTGIRVFDNPASSHDNVQLSLGTGVLVNNGTDGLVIQNASAAVTAMNDVAFSGQTGSYIKLINNANNLNATTATFGGVTGASATLSQLFAIEDKITHKIDNSALGFVTVKANNDYVTTNSFVSPNTAGSIQRGVDAASNGFTVNVNSGTYNESVLVNKSVSILGAQSGVLAKGRSGAESIVDPNVSAANGFKVVTDNVTVDGFTITNSATYPANERYGVVTIDKASSGQFTGIAVKNNVISRQSKAIDFNFTDNFNISGNWLHGENDAYNYGCIWVDDYGTSSANGLITNNDLDGYSSAVEIQGDLTHPVSNTTISLNRSTGSQYVLFGLQNSTVYRNSVLNVTTGSHVYVGGGNKNVTMSENFFDNGTSNGIRVENIYGSGINSNLTITNNSITGHNATGKYEINVDPSGYSGTLAATCNWFVLHYPINSCREDFRSC